MQLTMLNKSLYSFSIITFQLFFISSFIYFRGICNNNSGLVYVNIEVLHMLCN